MLSKIIELDDLSKKISKIKKKNRKIVLCHGAFDVLHVGHFRHFKKAKSLGDILVVNLTKDKFISKGPGRPVFKLSERLEALSSLKYIDFITFNNMPNAIDVIKKIKPNYYCKGEDYLKQENDTTKQIKKEQQAVEKYGGQLLITKEGKFSSSKISNSYNLSISKDQSKIIKSIKKRFSLSDILEILNRIEKEKILVIGEIILDKYIFVEAIGKSGKDPILMFEEKYQESYLGGSAAVTNHLADFSKNIQLFSFIGKKNNDEVNFIKSNLKKNIKLIPLFKKKSSNLIKKKYIDYVSKSKIIGFYSFRQFENKFFEEKKINIFLKKNINKSDITLITDYGHGILSDKSAKIVSDKKNFVYLNAQINAGNIANHSIKKYNNLECVVINESELRHEMRDSQSKIKVLIKKISIAQNLKYVCVTMGANGSILFNKKKNSFFECKAFADRVIDRIGAGDSMLAILSCVLKVSKDEELALLLGSLASAQQVANFGNSFYVSKNQLVKVLQHLF